MSAHNNNIILINKIKMNNKLSQIKIGYNKFFNTFSKNKCN